MRRISNSDVNSGSSAQTDDDYEDQARANLPAILLDRCGLYVVRDSDCSCSAFEGLELDF